jgi:hypothetical protein
MHFGNIQRGCLIDNTQKGQKNEVMTYIYFLKWYEITGEELLKKQSAWETELPGMSVYCCQVHKTQKQV